MSQETKFQVRVEIGSDSTGVSIPEGTSISSFQTNFDYAIRIAIHAGEGDENRLEQCHFLQFITRQGPCEFSWKELGEPMWINTREFTDDSEKPKWRVDSVPQTRPSPFYEAGGVHVLDHEAKEFAIYDQPEITSDYERVVATTFIINDEGRVFKEVRWSRQYVAIADSVVPVYEFEMYNAKQLPDWALHTLRDSYDTNDYQKCAYSILPSLDRVELVCPEEALQAAKNSFLLAPENWVTAHVDAFSRLAVGQTRQTEQLEAQTASSTTAEAETHFFSCTNIHEGGKTVAPVCLPPRF